MRAEREIEVRCVGIDASCRVDTFTLTGGASICNWRGSKPQC